jgi:pyroglutamyl-peptidase
VLLTGFEPFAQYASNSSWDVVSGLMREVKAGRVRLPAKIVAKRMPVVFSKVLPTVFAAVRAVRPDIVICCGQAPMPAIRVECVAVNDTDGTDNSKRRMKGVPIVRGGPAAYASTIPCGKIVRELRRGGVPCALSYHAGLHMCNFILYGLRHHVETNNLPIRVGFIHIPLTPSQVARSENPAPSMALELSVRALEIVVRCVCGASRCLSH